MLSGRPTHSVFEAFRPERALASFLPESGRRTSREISLKDSSGIMSRPAQPTYDPNLVEVKSKVSASRFMLRVGQRLQNGLVAKLTHTPT